MDMNSVHVVLDVEYEQSNVYYHSDLKPSLPFAIISSTFRHIPCPSSFFLYHHRHLALLTFPRSASTLCRHSMYTAPC